jgi:RNA polymerase sigma factor (TIGR02999 family)
MANKLMNKERNNHTLSPTDLVHEAFIKLSGSGVSFDDQKHYFRTLARQMRRVLIDYARNKSRIKNKGKINNVIYTDSLGLLDTSIDFTHISDAIDELENMDASSAEAIDLVYFSALPQAQAANFLSVSLATIERNLKFGRAFINEYIYNLGLYNDD